MPLFSKRMRMGEAAVEWCKERGASPHSPVNIVTALLSLGLVVAMTDEEREAVEAAYSRLTADTHYATVAATLRGLLDRTELRREIGSA